jgi:4-aminobutyrate aminotransferase-like enzyme
VQADRLAVRLRERLEELAARLSMVGEVRGLGPMLAIELVVDPDSKEPNGDLAKRTTELAREKGLVLLTCGLDGNVIRILVPILAADEDVQEGLAVLEEALVDAGAGPG